MAERTEGDLVQAHDGEGHTFRVTRADADLLGYTVDEPEKAKRAERAAADDEQVDEAKAEQPAENKARGAAPENKGR